MPRKVRIIKISIVIVIQNILFWTADIIQY